jgi:hypothetical protein
MTNRFILVGFLWVFSSAAQVATPADYKGRIESAHKNVVNMLSAVEGASGREYDEYLGRAETSLKHTIPETEKIEAGGSVIETSNDWLRSGIEQFDKAATKAERIKILLSISDRLAAIDARLNELETTNAADRSKDEDKQKLAEILRREEYRKPEQAGESLYQRIYREFIEWLADFFPHPNISPVDPSGLQPLSVVLQFLIYGTVIGLVGFLIYKFGPVIAERFRKRDQENATSRVILGEHISESVSASDLFSEAETLARQGDLRAAIRKGYIALLCDLADKKVIGLARHKTNRDYLRDLRTRTPLFERVKRATASFERHWYGFRKPAPADWDDFTEQYRAAADEGSG